MKHCLLLLITAALATSAHADDAEVGRSLYQARCTACHSLDYNGVGPAHRGVFGRRIASAPGFAYSDALKARQQSWTEITLDQWLADPEAFAPGQRMGINVADAKERSELIAYLRLISRSADGINPSPQR